MNPKHRAIRALTLTALAGAAPAALAGDPVEFYLTILHNNDGESQLIAAPGEPDFGGVARFKTLADTLKGEALVFPASPAEHGVVMISSGDNFLAGPEFNASLELPTGTPFYDALAMEMIGYDAAAIGNHEFDFGPDVLEAFITGFTTPVPFLSANLDFTLEPGLAALVPSRIAPSMIVTVGSKQVGIIGATTPTLPFVSSPRDVIVSDMVAPLVQAEIDAMTTGGVDIVILSSHLQSVEEEIALLSDLTGVDAVIAGGGDELLANPGDLLVPGDDAATLNDGQSGYPVFGTDMLGASVPVITTAGEYKYIGRLILGFDASGNVVEIDPASGPVRVSGVAPDAVSADAGVQSAVVDPVEASIASLAANVIGVSEVDLDGRRSSVRGFETNQGNLIADAFLWSATNLAPAFGAPVPDVALANGGGIRNDSVIPAGDYTELDTFDALPFSNFVSTVESIPAEQFKRILENAVSQVEFGNGRFAQVAGCRFFYSTSAQAQIIDADTGLVTQTGRRVLEAYLSDGTPIVLAGEPVDGVFLNVATVDFLARGGDQYPFDGAPFTPLGVSYQASLEDYIVTGLGGSITGAQYPEGGEGRIVAISGCNAADLSAPFGALDFSDVVSFLQAFGAGEASADLAPGFGVLDMTDVQLFLNRFGAGCP